MMIIVMITDDNDDGDDDDDGDDGDDDDDMFVFLCCCGFCLFFAFLLALLWASREFGLCLLMSFWLQRLSRSGSSALAQAFWRKDQT